MIITRDLYLDRLKRKANNELVTRGYEVDVGIVRKESKDNEGKRGLKNLEIGFVSNKGNERFYVQSAYSIPTVEKMNQETSSLNSVPDSFPKVIVTQDNVAPYHTEKGYLVINVLDFLLGQKQKKKASIGGQVFLHRILFEIAFRVGADGHDVPAFAFGFLDGLFHEASGQPLPAIGGIDEGVFNDHRVVLTRPRDVAGYLHSVEKVDGRVPDLKFHASFL